MQRERQVNERESREGMSRDAERENERRREGEERSGRTNGDAKRMTGNGEECWGWGAMKRNREGMERECKG